jgi:hypothetical protein
MQDQRNMSKASSSVHFTCSSSLVLNSGKRLSQGQEMQLVANSSRMSRQTGQPRQEIVRVLALGNLASSVGSGAKATGAWNRQRGKPSILIP